ncbi:MAG TPA: DUF3891 family protein [Candidatus Angelobacter sp.]|nr:DUF3891 family protein [Candidatus Angelobacter sp.]
MILRPLEPEPAAGESFVEAWPVVEQLQRRRYESCWMITQPSHAALSGEIAAKLSGAHIPKLDLPIIRAIALHDAGWGMPDAHAITHSRSRSGGSPQSFLQTELAEFLTAWTQSAEIAQKASATGGYMVSRHFWRLAEHRLAHGDDAAAARKKIESFLKAEAARQKKLAAKQNKTAEELEQLTDLLQLCDLISLYICSGAQQRVRLPECCGVRSRLTVQGSNYRFEPQMVKGGAQFSLAALRYPATKDESSREFQVRIE